MDFRKESTCVTFETFNLVIKRKLKMNFLPVIFQESINVYLFTVRSLILSIQSLQNFFEEWVNNKHGA